MFKNSYKPKMGRKGFTIIELIVVIAVIGILVLLAMTKFFGYIEESKVTVIRHDVKITEGIIFLNNYEIHHPPTILLCKTLEVDAFFH